MSSGTTLGCAADVSLIVNSSTWSQIQFVFGRLRGSCSWTLGIAGRLGVLHTGTPELKAVSKALL